MPIQSDYLDRIFNKERFKDRLDDAKKKLKGVKFDAIAVSGNSGTIFGGALAQKLKKELILVRKENDCGHSHYNIEGDYSSKKYIFVDDFISSGRTKKFVMTSLSKDEVFAHLDYVGTYEYCNNLWNPAPSYKR